jgi:hypothetical protein
VVAGGVSALPAGGIDDDAAGGFAGGREELDLSVLNGEGSVDDVQDIAEGEVDLALCGVEGNRLLGAKRGSQGEGAEEKKWCEKSERSWWVRFVLRESHGERGTFVVQLAKILRRHRLRLSTTRSRGFRGADEKGHGEVGADPRACGGEGDIDPVPGVAVTAKAESRYQTLLQVAAGMRRREETAALNMT